MVRYYLIFVFLIYEMKTIEFSAVATMKDLTDTKTEVQAIKTDLRGNYILIKQKNEGKLIIVLL